MKDILEKIFISNEFQKKEIEWDSFKSHTYTNSNSETYIVLFIEGVPNDLEIDIISLCSNYIYNTKSLTKANKSNLNIVIVSKLETELTEREYNQIYMIEENNLYYKKFFLWYMEGELVKFKELLGVDYSSSNLNKMIIDYEEFREFKRSEQNNIGYSLLTRIYIKLAFLTLAEIKNINRSLSDYIKDSVNEINEQLFEEISKNLDQEDLIDNCLNFINLTEKEIIKINKEIEGVDFDEQR